MPLSLINRRLCGAWALFGGTCLAVALVLKPGRSLMAVGDVALCFAPLLANAGLLLNAGTSNWRRNAFWTLLALSCTAWMTAQFGWTYYEVYLHKAVPAVFGGDIVIFLHGVPTIAALALQPHRQWVGRNTAHRYLDLVLLFLWWIYLFLFMVTAWTKVNPDGALYVHNLNLLSHIQNLVILAGFGMLWLTTRGAWRVTYAHLFGAASAYTLASLPIKFVTLSGTYYARSLYDLPLIVSFLWYGTAGIIAYQMSLRESSSIPSELKIKEKGARNEGVWPARLAMVAVLSMPLLAIWCVRSSSDPPAVRNFRLLVTLIAAIPLSSLVFLRQSFLNRERQEVIDESNATLEHMTRMQTQLVQSEKLISLGQLAAGAAHEINNPLTAILGYADLLAADPSVGERARSLATKIGDQARRTKTLVTNLLTFSRQVPAERTLLDINAVVATAVQLRALDLRGDRVRIEIRTETVLPAVRADSNQLVQVCFNIVSNAIDALEEVGGGVLTVKTHRERANVVLTFSDTGPGIKEPNRVFDPFYTTKPVGKGTGLGLSICYGLVQEHGGTITCFNAEGGGATFRVELPAVLALFSTREAATLVAQSGSKL
ncbi:MAG TPA: HAMP domain-containing sensor histidine kinase [Candidatus Dormibacteraeota bacterium]|nr:HAMP domain-containing sensor histidine kinase [Candidatus Dormibacteraeota bacterium]